MTICCIYFCCFIVGDIASLRHYSGYFKHFVLFTVLRFCAIADLPVCKESKCKLETVGIIAMYCYLRLPDVIAFPIDMVWGFKSELQTDPMPFHLVAVGGHVNAA